MQRAIERDETPPLGSMPAEELPPAAEQVLAETPEALRVAIRVGRSWLVRSPRRGRRV